MARIRSILPDQFTDSAFMPLSAFAKVMLFGLRCHADDNGIFRWDAAQIKVRILPMDEVDVDTILQELIDLHHIYTFEVNGKKYGILRNFVRFQKPHKPSFQFPVPDEMPNGCVLHPKYLENNEYISEIPTDVQESSGDPTDSPGKSRPPEDARLGGVRKGGVRKGKEGRVKTVLPLPFILTDDMKKWATEKEPTVNIMRETDRFVDHFRPPDGEKKKNWTQTWQGWIRRSVDFRGSNTTGTVQPKGPVYCKIHPNVGMKNDECYRCRMEEN